MTASIIAAIVVVVLLLAAVGTYLVRRRRGLDHDGVPGTHSRSRKQPIGARDTNDPIAPPEAAVDVPTETPDDAPDIAAPEAGNPSPSKNHRSPQ